MKFILKRITSNHSLMLRVLFYIADKVVASTENDLDDRILAVLKKVLGEIDFNDVEEEVDNLIEAT